MDKEKILDTYTLVIDQSVLDRYNEYYFTKYPRRKKPPISRPVHESLNVWAIMTSMARNNLKQRWKEFVVWWLGTMSLKPVDVCDIRFNSVMPTRRRADPDNMVPKFILDGIVESGLLKDDDSLHLRNLILCCSYEKGQARTEITIYVRKYA